MNLLVTGAFNCTDLELQTLSNIGNNVIFLQMENEALPCPYDWVEGVICNGLFLHHPIEKFTNLKYIQLTSAGFDRIPMEYVQQHDIKLYGARGVYSIPMAEFAICGVLEIYKKSRFFIENQTKRIWEKNRNFLELFGKTVCIVGCGNVGSECAKRFKAFGTTIYAVDTRKPDTEIYDKYFSIDEITSATRESDIIILSLPLTAQTKQLFNAKMLTHLKSTAVLVNISRGAIIDQADLIHALQNNKLFGAVLDVFETEPLEENSPLWNMENVIITPHNSFVGENNHQRLKDVVFNNLLEVFK